MRQTLLLLLAAFGLCHAASAQVTAAFTATPTSGCAPMVVTFSNTSSGATGYSWSFGNSTSSTAANPTTSYSTAGTYTVTLTASNGTSTSTATATITVKQPPTVATSAGTTSACPGTSVSFTSTVTWNSAGGGTYLWDFGDGATSTAASPAHAWNAGGTYKVILTATNSVGCPTADTIPIIIYPKPTVSISASDTAICTLGGATTFSASASGAGTLSYAWDFGDGTTSSAATPLTHNYLTAGRFTPSLIITDANGCKDTVSRSNYIRVIGMTASMTAPATICAGASVPVSAGSSTTASPSNISWAFGDGNTATGTSTANTYVAGGTYSIVMTAVNGGCTATATQSIVVYPKPSSQFAWMPLAPCPAPAVMTFTPTTVTTGVAYAWDFGDGTTGSGSPAAHTYNRDDTFLVKLTATSANGCASSTIQKMEILPMVGAVMPDTPGGCIPLTVTFKDTLRTHHPGGMLFSYPYAQTGWLWNFGDGSATTTARYPSHTYTVAGTYNVTCTVTTVNGCTVTDTFVMKCGTRPVASFRASTTTACVNEFISFLDSSHTTGSIPVNEWRWEFGDSTTSIARWPIQAYGNAGTYTVTLRAGINGCYDTFVRTAYINVNWPRASMRKQISCDTPGLVHFVDSSVGATAHVLYFGDGTSSTASSVSHQYAPGLYTPMLVAYNSTTGCRDTVRLYLNLNPVNLSFFANDSAVCKDDTVTFTGSVTGGNAIAQYDWWIGPATSTPVYSPPPATTILERVFAVRGQYSVALRVKDGNGCFTELKKNNYITVGPPQTVFRVSSQTGCSPATIVFKDSSLYTTSTFAISRHWDFGDGTSTTTAAQSISHNYTSSGSYGITLITTDNIGCSDTLYIPNYVAIYKPRALWSTTGTKACVGMPFNFFNSSSGASLTYLWDFGDGTTSTASGPSHAYTVTGTYTIKLIVTDVAGCRDSMIKPAYISVIGPPSAAFFMSDTLNVCPPMVVNFTDLSTGAVGYNWTLGNGASSTLQNPAATYITPGVYTIRLIVTNAGGCRDTADGRVRVLGYAGVLSYTPLNGCAPLTVSFRANNVLAVPGFIYDFGDGATAATTAHSITHTYTKAGPFVPKITLTDNLGCSAVSIGLDTIKIDGVVAGYTYAPYPACGKGTYTFVDTSRSLYSGIASRMWKFYDGTTSTAATTSLYYFSPAGYNVTLYHTTVYGCKDTLNSTFRVWPVAEIDAGQDTTICLTDAAILKPAGGMSYAWSPAATLSCTGCENPAASPTEGTRYIVVGTDEHGCVNRDSVTVFVKTKVMATVTGGGEMCGGDTVQLTATGGGTYEWSPATGLSRADTSSPRALPATTQQYVLITRLASCIPDTDYVDLIVHPTPEVAAGPDVTMIAGTPVTLSATGSPFVAAWSWTPEAGLSCVHCTDPVASPVRTTTYVVTGSTDYGCRTSDSITVFVVCNNSQLYLPNTFTPDGNGVNDVFYPRGRGVATINSFRIYNRWGEVVFDKRNIAADDRAQGWDGRMVGTVLGPDVYVYVIEATCDTGEPMKFQGDVMLLR